MFRRAILSLGFAAFCFGQSAHFEVASVKPATPGVRPEYYGGPGPRSKDPERVHWSSISVQDLLMSALGIGPGLITGPPAIESHYQVDAKIPAGATVDEFREMIGNLLTERFGLTYHRAPKEVAGYELIVAPDGTKAALKSVTADSAKPQPFVSRMQVRDGVLHLSFMGATMGQAANQISRAFSEPGATGIQTPVVNKTALTGNYEFEFDLPSSELQRGRPTADPKSASAVLEKEFGLKLNLVKMTVEFIVVDHVEKVPAEN